MKREPTSANEPAEEFDELLLYLEGDVTQRRARELEAMPGHAERVASVRALTDRLALADPALEAIDLVPDLHRALGEAPPSRRRAPAWAVPLRWPGAALVGLAAAAALVVVVATPLAERNDEFRPKGGAQAGEADRWAGVDVYRLGDAPQAAQVPLAQRAEERLRAGDALAFAYRNGGTQPFEYLMIFGVDASGEVRWFHPQWTDAGTTPQSIAIAPTASAATELRTAVQHELPTGPLMVHALFSRRPLTVLEVEQGLADLAKWPDTFDQRRAFFVEP